MCGVASGKLLIDFQKHWAAFDPSRSSEDPCRGPCGHKTHAQPNVWSQSGLKNQSVVHKDPLNVPRHSQRVAKEFPKGPNRPQWNPKKLKYMADWGPLGALWDPFWGPHWTLGQPRLRVSPLQTTKRHSIRLARASFASLNFSELFIGSPGISWGRLGPPGLSWASLGIWGGSCNCAAPPIENLVKKMEFPFGCTSTMQF